MRGIEIRHLRYFQRVADKLHFGRAAEVLGVSQAPLSQQIRQLEERIGVRLFDRNTRNVRLTPAGRVFAEKVDMIMNAFGDAIDDARMAGGLGLRLIHTVEMVCGHRPGYEERRRRKYSSFSSPSRHSSRACGPHP